MSSHSYFVVMIDYGARWSGRVIDRNSPRGMEAIVDPEITRREVIARLQSQEYQDIAFIHHVHDGEVDDVTEELLTEANVLEAA